MLPSADIWTKVPFEWWPLTSFHHWILNAGPPSERICLFPHFLCKPEERRRTTSIHLRLAEHFCEIAAQRSLSLTLHLLGEKVIALQAHAGRIIFIPSAHLKRRFREPIKDKLIQFELDCVDCCCHHFAGTNIIDYRPNFNPPLHCLLAGRK